MAQYQGLLGLAVIPLIAWIVSENRGALHPARTARMIAAALLIQASVAGALLNTPTLRAAFEWPARAVDALQEATLAGVRMVFGFLAGGPSPFETTHPENGFVLAFQALPLILLISVLSKLLYHWGVLQILVAGFSWCLRRSMGVSGAVGTSAAANIFVGMVEAPLFVRPYLKNMSRAGLFATMTVGMAGVAGTVLAIYASILKASVPGAAAHLIIASVISVPAGLLIAQLMVPEDTSSTSTETTPNVALSMDDAPQSSMDAIAQGTQEGLSLLANVAAMLIVAVALVSLANMILNAAFMPFGLNIRLEFILGWIMAPAAWLIGIPWAEAATAGSLLGVKTVLNEFLAYIQMASIPDAELSPHSRLIMTYALCGFANFGSLGIMIGGLVAMVPERRADVISLGARTILSGTLATLMTAAIVGVLSPQ